MSILIIGLIIFLGLHSVRIVADDWRTRTPDDFARLARLQQRLTKCTPGQVIPFRRPA